MPTRQRNLRDTCSDLSGLIAFTALAAPDVEGMEQEQQSSHTMLDAHLGNFQSTSKGPENSRTCPRKLLLLGGDEGTVLLTASGAGCSSPQPSHPSTVIKATSSFKAVALKHTLYYPFLDIDSANSDFNQAACN
ncbi:hypothetical protein IHE44_0001251 [Lamprotornis superbus]|uniref:Uncharacterized protein n=1 Tax=Lamprotornis superbus TaxID=245042 RepID=A0A835NUC1_9PASS|nr:hypothetical protein IHE44_0001251 [Lamprotornis superbus]